MPSLLRLVASALGKPKTSLRFLLSTFLRIETDKSYQNADWLARYAKQKSPGSEVFGGVSIGAERMHGMQRSFECKQACLAIGRVWRALAGPGWVLSAYSNGKAVRRSAGQATLGLNCGLHCVCHRPVQPAMQQYAAEDSAYLLPLFVAMRRELLEASLCDVNLLTKAFDKCQALTLKVYEKDFFRSVEAQMQESEPCASSALYAEPRQRSTVMFRLDAGCAQGKARFDEHCRTSHAPRPGRVEGSDGCRVQHTASNSRP